MRRLLPHLLVDPINPDIGIDIPGRSRHRDAVIEIGFGGGEHLAGLARRCPDPLYIGCEPYWNGISRLLRQIEEDRIENIRIYPGDGNALIEGLPSASIRCVFLLFPDPWPKKRHSKRRFIQPHSLDQLARIMRPGAVLHIASDMPIYLEHVLFHMNQRKDFIWNANRADDWRRPPPDWIVTRYQEKARRQHRASVWLSFTRAAKE